MTLGSPAEKIGTVAEPLEKKTTGSPVEEPRPPIEPLEKKTAESPAEKTATPLETLEKKTEDSPAEEPPTPPEPLEKKKTTTLLESLELQTAEASAETPAAKSASGDLSDVLVDWDVFSQRAYYIDPVTQEKIYSTKLVKPDDAVLVTAVWCEGSVGGGEEVLRRELDSVTDLPGEYIPEMKAPPPQDAEIFDILDDSQKYQVRKWRRDNESLWRVQFKKTGAKDSWKQLVQLSDKPFAGHSDKTAAERCGQAIQELLNFVIAEHTIDKQKIGERKRTLLAASIDPP